MLYASLKRISGVDSANMAATSNGGLNALPREIQSIIAVHVRGESYALPEYSLADLCNLRLCSKRWAELGEPLLYEFRMEEPLMYNLEVDEEGLHYPKCEANLRAGFFALALPPNLLLAQIGAGSKESMEILLTDADMGTAAMIRKCSKMTEATLSCRTTKTEESGHIRILRSTFNAICSSRTLTHIEMGGVDGFAGIGLAAELVEAMTSLHKFGLTMTSSGTGFSTMVNAHRDFETLAARFRLTRAISRASNLKELHLAGPCISDVAEHRTFVTRLNTLSVASQDAPKATSLLVASSLDTLGFVSIDAKCLSEVCKLTHVDKVTMLNIHTLDLSFTLDAMNENNDLLPNAPALKRLGIMAIKGATALAVQIVKSDFYSSLQAVKIMQRERDESAKQIAELCSERGMQLYDTYVTEAEDMPPELQNLLGLIASEAGPEEMMAALGQVGVQFDDEPGDVDEVSDHGGGGSGEDEDAADDT